jgi:broad specificity phosphatase PhoE
VTATLYLIRHAPHDHLGHILSGRAPGIPLSDDGRGQARRLAAALSARRFAGVWSSPVQRARETAQEIVAGRGFEVQVDAALDEIDFGVWTGAKFEALAGDPAWGQWNSARGDARPPAGESMAEVQSRVATFARTLALAHPGEAVALVSHCDVIRAALSGWLGLSLDNALNFDVDPAGVSRVAIGDWGARVLSINEALA